MAILCISGIVVSHQPPATSFQPPAIDNRLELREGKILRDFKKLNVWEKSHQLALAVYQATAGFPKEELYGLTSQIRRAVVSIPSNIAKSSGRESIPDRIRFLHIAMGSANELEYQLMLARDLGFLDTTSHTNLDQLLTEVRRMLNGFVQTLKAGG